MVAIWSHLVGRHSLELGAKAAAEEELRHGQRLHPRRYVYRLYVRMWSGPALFSGRRIVGYSQSAGFSNFSDPVAILSTDKDDPTKAQFYNSAATKLSDGRYFMFPSALLPDGTLSVYVAFSRDGKHFRRLGRTPLLEPGKGFDKKGLYVGAGWCQAKSPIRIGSTTWACPWHTTPTSPPNFMATAASAGFCSTLPSDAGVYSGAGM